MKIIRMATAAAVLSAMINPALAQESCAKPAEAQALKTAMVQQQLMVAAFMCHDAAEYNRFVVTHQGELQSSDGVLKTYFIRRNGRHGEADYDTYKTKMANMWALNEARDDRAFCTVASQLFAAALESQAPLAAFVAAAPSVPGFVEVCIEQARKSHTRVAQNPAEPQDGSPDH